MPSCLVLLLLGAIGSVFPHPTPTVTQTPRPTLTRSVTSPPTSTAICTPTIAPSMTLIPTNTARPSKTATFPPFNPTSDTRFIDEAATRAAGGSSREQPTANVPTVQPPESMGDCPGFNYTCPRLTCAQAYACLKAGNDKLDRDRDGIPCEEQCGG